MKIKEPWEQVKNLNAPCKVKQRKVSFVFMSVEEHFSEEGM
jgi:hypothetical protein